MIKEYSIGKKLVFVPDDDPFRHELGCVVTEVNSDHCIAVTEDHLTLWIDEDTEYQFKEA